MAGSTLLRGMRPRQRDRLSKMLAGFDKGFQALSISVAALGITMEKATKILDRFHKRIPMDRTWTDATEIEFNAVKTDDLPAVMGRMFGLHPRLIASMVECYRCESLSMLMASNLEVYLEDADSDWDVEAKVLDVNADAYHFKLAVPESEKPDQWWLWGEIREFPSG